MIWYFYLGFCPQSVEFGNADGCIYAKSAKLIFILTLKHENIVSKSMFSSKVLKTGFEN